MNIYHYTSGLYRRCIDQDRFIRPRRPNNCSEQKPIVWFSSYMHFEPTALKVDPYKGVLIEPEEMFNGAYRYGLDTEDVAIMQILGIVQWDILKVQARISRKDRIALAVGGRELGSHSRWWYGTLKSVPIELMKKEKLNIETKKWESVK